jgi:hypothetical protein
LNGTALDDDAISGTLQPFGALFGCVEVGDTKMMGE